MSDTDPPKTSADDLDALKESADDAAASLSALSAFSLGAGNSFNSMGGMIKKATGAFDGFDSALKSVGLSLNMTKQLTDQQMTQFSLLSNFVLGAKESYTALGSVDTTGINTFSSQFDQLISIIQTKSAAPKLTKDAMEAMVTSLTKAGRPMAEIQQALSGGISAFGAYAKNVLTSADNALRLQNAYIKLAAQTGELGDVTKLAGDDFGNINALIEKQSHMMVKAEKATGASADEVSQYYALLGTIPGALKSVVVSSGDAADKTEMLTAAMKVARGTGRDMKDIVEDMKVAFRDYGIQGEGALKFSTRISEITQHLGVEFATVQNAMRATADSFKMYTSSGEGAMRMTEGIASIMNNYAQSLKETGLSGTQAVDVIKNMTGQIEKMDTAQKSFLSAQTGGSKGLMGAFQIDKMLQEGKIEEVFEKVRTQMQKQFGRIVSVDEASQSEAAARQLKKQMLLLQKGPLGQFARSDAEAEKILEMFSKGGVTKEGIKGLDQNIVQSSMNKGTALQEKSYTAVNQILGHVSAIRKAAETGTLKFMQQGFTAGAGSDLPFTKAQKENKRKLKAGMTDASVMTGDYEQSYAYAASTGELQDTSGMTAAKAIVAFKDFIKGAGDAILAPLDALKSAITSGDTKTATDKIKLLEDDVKRRKAAMAKMAIDKRSAAMEIIAREEAAIKEAQAYVDQAKGKPGPPPPKPLTVDLAKATGSDKPKPPGAIVGAAAFKASGTPGVGAAPGSPTGAGPGAGGLPPGSPAKSNVTVEVTGFCLNCKMEIDAKAHAKGVSTPANIPPKP